VRVIQMPPHPAVVSPIVHAIPLQLLAYHAALARARTWTSRATSRRA